MAETTMQMLLPGSDPTGAFPLVSLGEPQGHTGKGERIMIVEDDYFVALSVEADLRDAGYDVVAIVATGEDAINEGATLPALAIVDIRLAGILDGIETAIELRRMGIPAIFASAHTDEATKQRGMAAQPLGWLSKPYSKAELLIAVDNALRSPGVD
jgi:two-component system, response regulator PdtaR